ncbi:MAG: NUDIX domain-containing protein [Alphaproteobacteria bacterium]|nr:NUDIX domain-containing protein [Alphaproteobacteria bacterium]
MKKLPMKVFQQLSRWRRGKTLGARVAAIEEGRRVLLVRHGYIRGWSLPGGGVDKGETLREAAIRELREETGAVATGPLSLHGMFSNEAAFPGDHVALYIVREFERGPFMPSFEIREARFFERDKLPGDMTPGTKARLAEIFLGASVSDLWVP